MANEKPLKIKGTLFDVLDVAAKYVPPKKAAKSSRPKRKSRKKAAGKK
jgi:hypothetical protein